MKKLFAVVFVFALTFSIVYSFGDLSKSYLKAAKKAEQEKNYDEAIKYYKKIIKSDSSYNGSYWAIARIVEKQGNIQDAINWFKQSNEKGTKTMYAFIKIASYYKKLLNKAKTDDERKIYTQEAINAFENAEKYGNEKTESKESLLSNKEIASMQLSYLYYETGQYDKAKNYALESIKNKDNLDDDQDRQNAEELLLSFIWNIYTETKSFDKAIETIDKRLRKDPKSLSLLKLKINVLNKMGRKQDVLNEMKKMEELGSDDSDVTSWLAQDALNNKQYQKSHDLFEKLTKSDEESEKVTGYLGMGKNLMLMGKKKEGLAVMKKAEKASSNPNDPKIIVFLADAYQEAKDYNNAIAYYLKATMLTPNDYSVFLNLANAYQSKNPPNYQRAIKNLLKAQKLRPSSILPMLGLFYAYFNLKQFDKAYYWGKKILRKKKDASVSKYMKLMEQSGNLKK